MADSTNPLSIFTPPWAAIGTGLLPASTATTQELGSPLPPALLDFVYEQLPALFGGYPLSKDKAPSAVFVAVFSLLFLSHLFVFARNWSRGHRFIPNLVLAIYALFKVIGFGLRIKWAQDFLQVKIGIASVVFCQVPVLLLCVVNMHFATRIFTLRHPIAGRSTWYIANDIFIYFLVIGIIVMAILGTALPNIYFMTEAHYRMCQRAAEAAAIFQIIYALSGSLMLLVAYAFKPGQIDEKFVFGNKHRTPEEYPVVAQPTWIQRFSPFYYVNKGSQVPVYKDEEAYRVMPSHVIPAGGMVRNPLERYDGPTTTSAVSIVLISSAVLVLISCFRCAAIFKHQFVGTASFVFSISIFYVFYGAVEFLVNLFWLLARVDLRFYIPEKAIARDGPIPVAGATYETEKGSIDPHSSGSDVAAPGVIHETINEPVLAHEPVNEPVVAHEPVASHELA